MTIVFYNDNFIEQKDLSLCPTDRGFLFGDGIFDTCAARYGKIYRLSDHLDRLEKHAQILQLTGLPDRHNLQQNIQRLLALNNMENKPLVSIRTTLTRGTNHPRGILPASQGEAIPTLIIQANLVKPVQSTAKLVTTPIRRNEGSPLSSVKSLNYADAVLARLHAQKESADDVLFLNNQGMICCSSVANIFIIQGNQLLTPPLQDGVMDGTMRRAIIDIAKRNNIDFREQSLTYDDLITADIVFMTNTLMLIRKIHHLDNHSFPTQNNDVFTQLEQLLHDDINA